MRFPILVQFVYHPGSTEAVSVANYLHASLNDEPGVPGLRIPTCFIPDDGSGSPPEPELAPEAERVVVVLLADDCLAVNARKPAGSERTWGQYVVRLRQLCESSPSHRFLPVQLSEEAGPIDPALEDLNFLRAWKEAPEGRPQFIARRIFHTLIRRLRSGEGGEDAPPLTVFVSHTKLDIEQEPLVVKALLKHLDQSQPEKTWFDTGDIATGSRFATAIENAVADAALLAVITDSYSSRSWCRREVLLAKRYQRPVVVVDAVQEREVRSFPYIGNVPVVRWKGDPNAAIDLLLKESLRHLYAEENLRQYGGENLLPAGPELLTLVHRDKSRPLLYPDPPLGPEELAVLEHTGIQIETPLQRYAKANQFGPKSLVVALSISESEDIGRFGLRGFHLDSILLELSRYLLLAGIRLSYGGHLKASGYTTRLVDLLHDPVVELLRANTTKPQAPTSQPAPQLISYIAWPMTATIKDEAKLGPLVELKRCSRPADVDETLDASLVAEPATEVPSDSSSRRFGWARGLSEMRKRQSEETNARIVIGGKIGSGQFPYKGRIPGTLEEALLSMEQGRPVYLVGAFGGCARLILDTLMRTPRPELTWTHQSQVPNSEGLRDLYGQRGVPWDDYEAIAARLSERGIAGLGNGLSAEENQELAVTRSAERIIALILSGLQKTYPS